MMNVLRVDPQILCASSAAICAKNENLLISTLESVK